MEAIKLDKFDETAVYAQHVKCKLKIYLEAMVQSGLNRIIIGSGGLSPRFRDDLNLPYFASAYFNEFVPLRQHPNSFLVIEAGSLPALFVQHHDDYWHSKPVALPPNFAEQFVVNKYVGEPDIQAVKATAYIGSSLADLPDNVAQTAILNPDMLLFYVDYYRAWKTDYEQDCLRDANIKAVLGHKAAEAAFRQGYSEYDIHMAYLSAINSRESELPYGNIVALNENAAVLHHRHLSTEKPSESRSFLIDAGAGFRGYGSDISRTYFKENAHSAFVALVKGVNELQQNLVEEVQPGKSYIDIHLSAHQRIAELLCAIGLFTCSADEALDMGLTNAFFLMVLVIY